MFQFPGFAFVPLCIQGQIPSFDNRKSEAGSPKEALKPPASKFQLSKVGFPIRKSAGQRPFAPHHSLSQRTTSFIASYRQGIHQMLLGHLIALISNAHRLPQSFHHWSGGTSKATLGMMSITQKDQNSRSTQTAVAVATNRPCGSTGRGCPVPQAYLLFTMYNRTRSGRTRRVFHIFNMDGSFPPLKRC